MSQTLPSLTDASWPALTMIVLLPLIGFLINGVLSTALGGNRVGHRFVNVVACGMPLAAFAIAITMFLQLRAGCRSCRSCSSCAPSWSSRRTAARR